MKNYKTLFLIYFCLGAISSVCSITPLEGTWELFKTHEIYFKVDQSNDTSLTDTVFLEAPQCDFYKFSGDSLFEYDLDYEDSKQRNCYMLWAHPFKLLDDSTLYRDNMGYKEVSIITTFKISNDTLLYIELWWEDWPNYTYHQSKYRYYVKRDNQILPPMNWPNYECHSNTVINSKPIRTTLSKANKTNYFYNMLGQKMTIVTAPNLRITKNSISIGLTK